MQQEMRLALMALQEILVIRKLTLDNMMRKERFLALVLERRFTGVRFLMK